MTMIESDGGTGFRGAVHPEITLEFGHDDLYVPYSLLEATKTRVVGASKIKGAHKQAMPRLGSEI